MPRSSASSLPSAIGWESILDVVAAAFVGLGAVDAQVCVCYCRRDTGGTAMTVRYAKEKGLRIIAL